LEGADLAGLGRRERESLVATLEILADRNLAARLRKLAKRTDADVLAGNLQTMEHVFGGRR
jgi:predicted short-subunit dehydrogenase-like oxidoreductase (DUF2520 family)